MLSQEEPTSSSFESKLIVSTPMDCGVKEPSTLILFSIEALETVFFTKSSTSQPF